MHTGEKAGHTENTVNSKFIVKLVLKIIGCLVCVYSIVVMVWNKVDEAIFDARYESESYHMSYMEDSYAQRRYAYIFSNINLYDLRGETFDKYTEICQGYNDYILARAYMLCEMKEASPELIPENRTEEYRSGLEETIRASEYPTNRKQIQRWLEELDSLEQAEEQTETVED